MTPCSHADRDGSYVLGALSPTEREEYERHLAGCAPCAEAVRDLAGLPGLLSRVDETVLTSAPGPVPDTLLPRLVNAVERARKRRRLVTTGLAAAAVLAVVGAAVTVGVAGRTDPAPSATPPVSVEARPMQPVAGAPVEGLLTVETVPWGTRLTLQCTYPVTADGYGGAQATGYVLVVRTRDGLEEEVATWNEVAGAMELTAATATGSAAITAVEVRTDSGRPVLRLRG